MKRWKRVLACLLAAGMIGTMAPMGGLADTFSEMSLTAHAAEIIASGTCGAEGDNLTWTLDAVGLLTISGEGEMGIWLR